MFEEIDKEEDGEVYYREVVDYLRSVNQDMDQELNLKVTPSLDTILPIVYMRLIVIPTSVLHSNKQE
jgi:hypothetical protein